MNIKRDPLADLLSKQSMLVDGSRSLPASTSSARMRVLSFGQSFVDGYFANCERLGGQPVERLGLNGPTTDEERLVVACAIHVLVSYAKAFGLYDLLIGIVGNPYEGVDGTPDALLKMLGIDAGTAQNPQSVLELLLTDGFAYLNVMTTLCDRMVDRALEIHRARANCRRPARLEEVDRLLACRLHSRPKRELKYTPADRVRVEVRDAVRAVDSGRTSPSTTTAVPVATPAREHLSRIKALEGEIDSLRGQLMLAHQSRDDEERVERQQAGIIKGLRARVWALERRLDAVDMTPESATPTSSLPASWDELPLFCDQRLAGRVLLTQKAIRSARASVFQAIPFAYEVLLMLAEDYVPMRRGEEGARSRFERTCKRLRVEVALTGEAATHHQTRASYRAMHLGRTLALDMHVRGRSSRDPRDCFRLYFAYVDDGDGLGYVVVGHLPTHLDNRQT